eukprot:TRINITY_DN26552_c0_g1_i1.p1 TRINITY_DN26552_c0_g1~~TRINITY_DN26552_c0_g1_i1.p1  ORF type:complete len:294 (-),score=41.13 TRINITY_DN26552_c0_g1_i1:1-882(-)
MSTLGALFSLDEAGDNNADFTYRPPPKSGKKKRAPVVSAAAASPASFDPVAASLPVSVSPPQGDHVLAKASVRVYDAATSTRLLDAIVFLHTVPHPAPPFLFSTYAHAHADGPIPPFAVVMSFFAKSQQCVAAHPVTPAFTSSIIYEPSPPPASAADSGAGRFSPRMILASNQLPSHSRILAAAAAAANGTTASDDVSVLTGTSASAVELQFRSASEKAAFAASLAVAAVASERTAHGLLGLASGGVASANLGGASADAPTVGAGDPCQGMVTSYPLTASMPPHDPNADGDAA